MGEGRKCVRVEGGGGLEWRVRGYWGCWVTGVIGVIRVIKVIRFLLVIIVIRAAWVNWGP